MLGSTGLAPPRCTIPPRRAGLSRPHVHGPVDHHLDTVLQVLRRHLDAAPQMVRGSDLFVRHGVGDAEHPVLGCLGERASGQAIGHPYFGTLTGPDSSRTGPLLSERGDPDTEVWGLDTRFARFDVNDLAVVDPNLTGALLGYCWVGSPQDLWTSANEWDLLIEGFEATFGAAQLSTQALTAVTEGHHLIVAGAIDDRDAERQAVRFDPIGATTAALPAPTPGPYTLTVFLEDEVVATTTFDIQEQHARVAPDEEEPPETGMFVVPIPVSELGYDRIEVELDDEVVGAVTASDNAPTVDIIAPVGGAVEDGDTVEVAWDAEDADGDPLTATVRYSPDGGTTWQTLGIDLEVPRLEVDRAELISSGAGVFEVVVSDGVLSSSTRTAPFELAGDGPLVLIESPRQGDTFYSGIQTIVLEATASEGGQAAIDDVRWTSDVDGHIADGAVTEVTADQLSVGTHVLTASADNGRGETGTAAVTIEVFRVPPPDEPPPPDDGPTPPPIGPVSSPVDDEDLTSACELLTDLAAGNVHLDAICALVGDGIVRGFSDGTFRPAASVTRGQVATVLVAASDLDAIVIDTPSFDDTADSVHSAAIEALHLAGIVAGFSDGSFRPYEDVRRDQFSAFVDRAR